MLRFEDRADGAVIVIDDETGGVIATAEPGTNGFLRGTLRGLMRARKRDGLAYSEPMKLERRADGELVLMDSKLGTVIAAQCLRTRRNAAVFGTMLRGKSRGASNGVNPFLAPKTEEVVCTVKVVNTFGALAAHVGLRR